MSPFLKLLLLIGFINCQHQALAQIDSFIYRSIPPSVNPENKGDLRITFDAMPFVRDNEYKSKLVKGYTLPGIWLDPTLSYQPLRNLKIELGAHMLHFWGANKYPNFNYSQLASWKGKNTQDGFHCVPIFRAQMQLTPTVNVILGTLYGKSHHRLIEPLYNDELNLSADPETGVQVIWDTRPFRLDTWVNWESFIFNNDKKQESFSFGLSARVQPSRKKARCQWYIPIQMLFQHRGGEINHEAEDRIIKTWLNAATGVGVDIPFHSRIITGLNIEATSSYYAQQAGNLLPFNKGYGFQCKATAHLWRCHMSLGYWYANDFVSIMGNPLFGTMSISNEGYLLDKQHMLTARIEYAQELGKGFSWGIHADIFNQFSTNAFSPEKGHHRQAPTLNFAAGICLRAYPSFLLKKF